MCKIEGPGRRAGRSEAQGSRTFSRKFPGPGPAADRVPAISSPPPGSAVPGGEVEAAAGTQAASAPCGPWLLSFQLPGGDDVQGTAGRSAHSAIGVRLVLGPLWLLCLGFPVVTKRAQAPLGGEASPRTLGEVGLGRSCTHNRAGSHPPEQQRDRHRHEWHLRASSGSSEGGERILQVETEAGEGQTACHLLL